MPINQEHDLWTDWICSIPSIIQGDVSEPRYALRYVYWKDGGRVKQVLYYEDGDGWRLHWWDTKGEGPEDGPDWHTWELCMSTPMEFEAAWNDIEGAVAEFKDKTEPGRNFPLFPPRISRGKEGYRRILVGDGVNRLKGPPLEALR